MKLTNLVLKIIKSPKKLVLKIFKNNNNEIIDNNSKANNIIINLFKIINLEI